GPVTRGMVEAEERPSVGPEVDGLFAPGSGAYLNQVALTSSAGGNAKSLLRGSSHWRLRPELSQRSHLNPGTATAVTLPVVVKPSLSCKRSDGWFQSWMKPRTSWQPWASNSSRRATWNSLATTPAERISK